MPLAPPRVRKKPFVGGVNEGDEGERRTPKQGQFGAHREGWWYTRGLEDGSKKRQQGEGGGLHAFRSISVSNACRGGGRRRGEEEDKGQCKEEEEDKRDMRAPAQQISPMARQ